MGNLVVIGQFWGGMVGFFGGMWVLFISVGFLWFVGVYMDMHLKRQ